MVDPVVALTTFALLTLGAALALWPERGLVPRLLRLAALSERVRLEDALKHVYTCERRGHPCTLESLAGRLEVSTVRAADLMSRLAAMGLVGAEGPGPTLTEEGRESALRVVRTHRLWERYLADRTGVAPARWHVEAERMEHALSADETEALSARLGHPRWDPHGDPIPTAAGDIPPFRPTSLLDVDAGAGVEVVHLEDEPPEIYRKLLAGGLAPGARLAVLDRGGAGVRFRVGGTERSLDPVAARNVTVRRLAADERAGDARATLLAVRPGREVRVAGLAPSCRGPQRRRLLDLGVVRGTSIAPELVSAAGDPVAYRIRGALVALRREQAAWILVEPAPNAPADRALDAGAAEATGVVRTSGVERVTPAGSG